jgi:hypothetical protein
MYSCNVRPSQVLNGRIPALISRSIEIMIKTENDIKRIWNLLEEIHDPEVPVLTVLDLVSFEMLK